MKRVFLILLLLLSIPTTIFAQGDKDILTRWLEDNLSGAGRTITIDGFSGALSAQSSLKRLTIADDVGVWLVLEDAVLNWKRAALLKGHLEIEELSAARVRLNRLPETSSTPLSAEASEVSTFRLPDLPVAIEIGTLSIGRVELNSSILGEPVSLTINGQTNLANGTGFAKVNITRLGSTQGDFQIDGSFDNATKILSLSLKLAEEQGGILANFLHLPDNPSLKLDLDGQGALPEFKANVDLQTAGQSRLNGQLQIVDNPDPGQLEKTFFDASLNGDITPLLVAEYRPFFGANSTLKLSGISSSEGKIELSTLSITTQAMEISGNLTLSADGLPENFDLVAELGGDEGTTTTLPLPGVPIHLGSAIIAGHFQSSESDVWSLSAEFTEFEHPSIQIDSGRVVSNGLMFRIPGAEPTQSVGRITADIVTKLNGLRPADQFLAQSLGSDVITTIALDWNAGQPLLIEAISVVADKLRAKANGTIAGNSDGFRISGVSNIDTGPLERISNLPGQPIRSGSGTLGVSGWWQPIGGAFDMSVNGFANALKLSNKPYYDLLEGDGTVNAAISRDTTGLHIGQLELQTPMLFAGIKGNIASQDSALGVEVKLNDLSSLNAEISGPASLVGTIKQPGKPWKIDVIAAGPGGTQAQIAGGFSETGEEADLTISGAFPLGLTNNFLPPDIALQGQVDFDLALNGPLNIKSLSGNISTNNSSAVLPVYKMSFGEITGAARISGGNAQLDFLADVSSGGQLAITGRQDIVGSYNSDLKIMLGNVALTDPPTFTTTLNGKLNLSGPIGNGSAVSGVIDLNETEIRLVPTSDSSAIPDITHIGESVRSRATRLRASVDNGAAATTSDRGSGIVLDVLLRAPSRIFIRGRGLDAELGGNLQISGTSNDLVPSGQFDLLRGRLDLLGKRFDLEEGQLTIQGSLQPNYNLTAITQTPDTTIRVTISGTPDNPNITFRSDPDLPEDEVLAQLIFGKSISRISPLQALQLANAISTLTGDGDVGVVGNIRNRFGLDDLDVVTTEDGSIAIQAGKYITENTYADVTANSEGKTEINLNLDLNPNLTVRGSATSEGETSLGLFFEKDY